MGQVDTNLAQYPEGQLESQFTAKVKEGDSQRVLDTLSKTGRELVESPFGGGFAKTSILYAAANADVQMCKRLIRYGGKELLKGQDLKKRDAYHYAKQKDFDIAKVTSDASVDCWNLKI